jgi:putative ABC transport system permease protein
MPDIPMNLLSIKLRDGYKKSTLDFIKSKWESFGANKPFNYFFLNENFSKSYESEGKLGHVFYTFAVLSIFIALLGLIGLSSFITAQRTKEIGIRKVLGASVEGITGLLYKESLLLVLVACAISIPISWYLLSGWLANFAYHVNISWYTFLIASITAVIGCLAAVSYHTLRAANSNPIVSIKYE